MASFFSTSLIEQRAAFNFLGLYIPSNLFYSLSNNVVPAVVVFSFALGAALIGLKDKEVLLKSLATLAGGLGQITSFLIRFAPFSVFAIIASATGTMSFSELQRLQVYILTPYPDVLNVPLAYTVARGDRELADFINVWIE